MFWRQPKTLQKCTGSGYISLSICDCWQQLFPEVYDPTIFGAYKSQLLHSFCLLFSLMAALHPTRLDEYCKLYNLSFFDLDIKCIFCKFKVSLQHLADFYCKDLSLVWKNNECFACCSPCLRLTARHEKENYFQCSVKGCMIESFLNTPLSKIVVRCIECYKKLDYMEKIQCCVQETDFCLIRCHWKNYCRFCKLLK